MFAGLRSHGCVALVNKWSHSGESNSKHTDYKTVALPIVLLWHINSTTRIALKPVPADSLLCGIRYIRGLCGYTNHGAIYGNRTHIICLEGRGPTVERILRIPSRIALELRQQTAVYGVAVIERKGEMPMAEQVGFEPTHGFRRLSVFKTVPLTTWVLFRMLNQNCTGSVITVRLLRAARYNGGHMKCPWQRESGLNRYTVYGY